MSKTILITGASKGFGKAWTEAFLAKGYNVAATARNLETLNDLKEKYGNSILPLKLDVNKRQESLEMVQKVKQHFGTIDVLINNAGYALTGADKEPSEQEARKQFEKIFFGTLWLTQAVVPIMREQKSGHIIQVSSILGLATLPTAMALYSASKFAVEGLSETLASEVKQFGINVTLLEPNGYESNIWHTGITSESIPYYDEIKKALAARVNIFGKVQATAPAVVNLVESKNPPLRLLLGKVALPFVKQSYEQRLENWEKWNAVSVEAHG